MDYIMSLVHMSVAPPLVCVGEARAWIVGGNKCVMKKALQPVQRERERALSHSHWLDSCLMKERMYINQQAEDEFYDL